MRNLTSIELLEKLVAFDTTSDRSNLLLIEFIEDYLHQYGISSIKIMDQSQKKANLYATIGPKNRGGIILSGHTDTVPVTGQNWVVDPYTMTHQNGRLYGRGAADMKGFLASVLASVPQMIKHDLLVPIHLAFSYDEEIGCIGVRSLIDYLAENHPKPIACIIGEPTSMKLTLAHKGKIALKVTVIGKSCHSGMSPYGINAITYANRLIHMIDLKTIEYMNTLDRDSRFLIPYTTMQVGVIKGGESVNIVPDNCTFNFEIRNIPSDNPYVFIEQLKAKANELIEEMRKVDEHTNIEFEWLTDYPGLSMSYEENFAKFIHNLLINKDIEPISFGTEGGLFQSKLGIPVIVCGPGNMAQGHQPNEFVMVDQLLQCDKFIGNLLDNLSDQSCITQIFNN